MCSLAAEAKKAGSASERTSLIPRLPRLLSQLACNHCTSEIFVLEMGLTADLE